MRGQQAGCWIGAVLVLVSTLWCAGAMAALGGAPWPGGQRTVVPAEASAASGSGYAIAATVLPSGTVVREFVNATDQVFAVSWEGPLLPDLAQLLGPYADEYQQAVQQQRAMGQRGGVVQVQKSQLVVVSRGRMGQFKGHAYVPTLVPVGLNMQALLP